MDLKDLISRGAFIDTGITPKGVVWESEGQTVEFDIHIKSEMSASDYEFIFFGFGAEEKSEAADRSIMARRVHRLCRLGDGREVISYEDACRMKHSLLLSICQKINEVHDAKPVDPEKK